MVLWIKAFHIMAVISWMAGLFYLPRLFVYHSQVEIGADTSETFKIMERKLLKMIMNPAMMVAWILGFLIAYLQQLWTEPWFLVKLALVFLLTIFHVFLGKCVKEFAVDIRLRNEKFYRVVNEVPTLLMVFIVLLVILKPF